MNSKENWHEFVEKPAEVIGRFVSTNKSTIAQQRDPVKIHQILSKAVLEQRDSWLDIPLINQMKSLDGLKSKSLVRFRCMVQDMFDPEYYLAIYETATANGDAGIGFGMYRDSLDGNEAGMTINHNSKSNVTMSRMTYYCISVPGENDWIRGKWNKLAPTIPSLLSNSSLATPVNEGKATREDENDSREDKEDEGVRKRIKSDADGSTSSSGPQPPKVAKDASRVNLCFPLNDLNPNRRACLVKVYDGDEHSFKLNDIVDVIGIVHFESPLETDVAADAASGDEKIDYVNSLVHGIDLDDNDSQFPSSLVPRIHALCISAVKHINPLIRTLEVPSQPTQFVEKIRIELHAILSQAMFGDTLAADYLICNLLSHIYMRKDVLSLGAFALNICNLPKMSKADMRMYTKSLYDLLAALTTHSIYFPLMLEGLNKGTFVPRKDYATNKLLAGHLQLPAGILMYVDETALETGQLSADGVSNVNLIGELIKWQKVRYDFKFHGMEMDTDVQVLVVSEGKSLLPVPYRLPLKVITAVTRILLVSSLSILTYLFNFILVYTDNSHRGNFRCY